MIRQNILISLLLCTLVACSGGGGDGNGNNDNAGGGNGGNGDAGGNPPTGGNSEPPIIDNPVVRSELRICENLCDFNLRDDTNNAAIDFDRPVPARSQLVADPQFDTEIMKVAESSQIPDDPDDPGVTERVRHYYSKANHLNADESMAIFFTNSGGTWIYETANWTPVQSLSLVSGDPEIHWHPTDPDVFYVVDFVLNDSFDNRAIYRYQVSSNTKTLIRDFAQYENASGQHEGNMDISGRDYAMIGDLPNGDRELFVYDVIDDSIVGPVPISVSETGDWVSVSPSGTFVVAMGNNYITVFDAANLNRLYSLPDGTYGHADICYMSDGREAIVFDGADYPMDPSHRTINAAILESGELIRVGTISWTQTPHISCRNTDLPGWALVSSYDRNDGEPTYNTLLDEIYWLKLDGTEAVRRIAHHQSDGFRNYFGEAHAVPNRDGSKIIFSSNWYERDQELAYVIDLTNLKTD